MRYKILKLCLAFLVLFSFPGFSQNTEQSAHPLLDKYYPRPQDAEPRPTVTDPIKPVPQTNRLPETKPIPQVNAITATKPVPVATDTTVINKPVNNPVPPPETQPVTESQPIAETKPVLETIPSSEIKPAIVETDTTSLIKPAAPVIKPAPTTVAVPTPKVNTGPAPAPYRSTRLGSSTPQYDTWEKNNNGAGSVTTSPK